MRVLVNIDVPQIESAVAFYRDARGLELRRMVSEDVAELVGTTATIYLLRNAARSRPSPDAAAARTYDRHWTPVHLDFVVDDVQKAAKRAATAGAIQESECVAGTVRSASRSPTRSDTAFV